MEVCQTLSSYCPSYSEDMRIFTLGVNICISFGCGAEVQPLLLKANLLISGLGCTFSSFNTTGLLVNKYLQTNIRNSREKTLICYHPKQSLWHRFHLETGNNLEEPNQPVEEYRFFFLPTGCYIMYNVVDDS